MNSLKQSIGFTLEAFSFIYGGILIGLGSFLTGLLMLVLAFALAYITGTIIKKDAIKEYKQFIKQN